ncbi:MAG: TonB family protein [Polyangiaceae bacterium]
MSVLPTEKTFGSRAISARARVLGWALRWLVGSVLYTQAQVGWAQPAPANVKPPVLLVFVDATYPEAAKARGEEAVVRLTLDIDATGRVTDARVQGSPAPGFDEAAREAALRFVFTPASRGDRPIASRIIYEYSFRLPKADPAQQTPPPAEAPSVGELRGRLMASGTDVELSGASVSLTGPQDQQTTTDSNGGFVFEKLMPGRYHVVVRAQGFYPVESDEEVEAGQSTDLLLRAKLVSTAPEVVVQGERPSREMTRRTLERRELSRIPGTNGDALRALQNMPGVARPPAIRGVLIVRGSAPQDTSIYIDGTPVPIVYHFGGLSSVVPTEAVERIDFYPGAFGARFGRATASIVDVGLRESRNDHRYHAMGQLDMIDTRFLAEGPVPGLNRWNFVIAGRRSWVDVWLGPILERRGGATAAPVYYDYQAFVETKPSATSRLRIGYFGSDDRLALFSAGNRGSLSTHTGFGRAQILYENRLSPSISTRAVVAYGYDTQDFTAETIYNQTTALPFSTRAEVSWSPVDWYTLHLGQDTVYKSTDVHIQTPSTQGRGGGNQRGPAGSTALLRESDTIHAFSPGVYSEIDIKPIKRLRLVGGVRLDLTGETSTWDSSPRLSGRYTLVSGFPSTVIKAGWGIYHQAPSARETSEVFGTTGLKTTRAIHYVAGFEQDLTYQINLSLEGFYKDLDRLVVRSAAADGSHRYDNTGVGHVIGAELLLRYKPDSRFFGWVAYTLSRSVRRDSANDPEVLFQYDQPHILTILGSYKLGRGWELGARFRYTSGSLYTPCLRGVYDATSGAYVCVAGTSYSARMPAFHQLDVRVDKTWTFQSWQLGVYLDLLNTYNRANPEAVVYNYNYSQKDYQSGLPIIPSLGVRGEF